VRLVVTEEMGLGLAPGEYQVLLFAWHVGCGLNFDDLLSTESRGTPFALLSHRPVTVAAGGDEHAVLAAVRGQARGGTGAVLLYDDDGEIHFDHIIRAGRPEEGICGTARLTMDDLASALRSG
jgi:hypothetical protein